MFQPEEPTPASVAEAPMREGKRGKRKHAKHRKHKRTPAADPVGAEGPMVGTLSFEDKPAVDDAPAMSAVALDLTWGDDGAHHVDLGSFPGPCAEVEPTPIGREGMERTPLWAVRCGPADAEKPTEMFLLQVGTSLSVIQRVEPSKQLPDRPRFRPVTKVPLVKGVKLEHGA